jgi:hypothetical protein
MMLDRRLLLLPFMLLGLAGCENSATAYKVEGSEHALMLMREQRYFWADEVEQAIVVARLPKCQRRVSIWPGSGDGPVMDVYEAGYQLWALQQGRRWYLASTEKCRVQDWADAPATPPGALVGSFRMRDGDMVFEPASGDK